MLIDYPTFSITRLSGPRCLETRWRNICRLNTPGLQTPAEHTHTHLPSEDFCPAYLHEDLLTVQDGVEALWVGAAEQDSVIDVHDEDQDLLLLPASGTRDDPGHWVRGLPRPVVGAVELQARRDEENM